MAELFKESADYILPLHMNGLAGRMLHVPSTMRPDREILIIYGHHAMLERWWSLTENLRDHGNVTMPDLPGFGGMESFSKIGLNPSVDNYADYLAAFMKLRYKRKKVTIYAISFGFTIATRMLQKYPELSKRVEFFISAGGFMHYKDFQWSRPTQIGFRITSRTFAYRPVSLLIRYIALNKPVVGTLTKLAPKSKHHFVSTTPEQFNEMINFEVKIWQANDVRTHWLTTGQFFTLDNTDKYINLPVIHLTSKGEAYFNNITVEQHMRQVFKHYTRFTSPGETHTPSTTADKKATSVMVPIGLRRLLAKKNS